MKKTDHGWERSVRVKATETGGKQADGDLAGLGLRTEITGIL